MGILWIFGFLLGVQVIEAAKELVKSVHRREILVPIAQVVSLDRTKIGKKSTRTAIDLVRKHGFNRIPVFENNTSNITGIVTLTTWEMLAVHANEKPISDMIKPAFYVAPNQTIDGLLPELRRREDHMAIVVNEFGSAIGMITMEDIVEEVLGEIDVGYDFEEYQPKRRHEFTELDDDVYLMDARVSISEANEVLGIRMPATEFHTLGGLVMARLRRIPREGDYIVELGYRLTVVEATDRALVKLRVEPNADAEAAGTVPERREAGFPEVEDDKTCIRDPKNEQDSLDEDVRAAEETTSGGSRKK